MALEQVGIAQRGLAVDAQAAADVVCIDQLPVERGNKLQQSRQGCRTLDIAHGDVRNVPLAMALAR